MARLDESFYSRSALELAPLLVGKLLFSNIGGIAQVRITDTEAYYGPLDSACHASKGKTLRTEIMFRRGGFAYIYLCYGIHHLLNIVTGPEGHPEAVLLRGGIGYVGPGRLTKAMGITKSLNGEDLLSSSLIWLEDDGFEAQCVASKRIGIDYAREEDRERLWRYTLKEQK
ncbi:MAG: DNA-3-methyladenine glycosylase [Clostridiales bacterium]|jgi:DNA-3-methyladenine glycosylase|nr:DNA-3-methyladenine glycosylase [Clostridiales bacterium]